MATHLGLLSKSTTAGRPSQMSGLCEQDTGPHVDLNSDVPLPYGWEQFLDLQTGQVYYVDWKNCRRSYMDPRNFPSKVLDNFDDSDASECMSDAENGCVSSIHSTKEVQTNKVLTIPLRQEDWDLMETRGWMALDCNDRSELTREMKPTARSPIVSETKSTFSPHQCELSIAKVNLSINNL
ncbi:hypothetical protein L7F22_038057 [Adiantum nelumboides]|nr:hypothetical protein [Adiantum nelumboides]